MTVFVPPSATTDLWRAVEEVDAIIGRMCGVMLAFSSSKGRQAADLRLKVGRLEANVRQFLLNNTIWARMLDAFEATIDAGIDLNALDNIIKQLKSEEPSTLLSLTAMQVSVVYALSIECRIIAGMKFVSRDDIEVVQRRMKISMDDAKEMSADNMDTNSYSKIVDMAAALARFLADVALPLPRVVQYQLAPMPSLVWAYRIYADASRYNELAADNKVVHPAFVAAEVRALSI